MTASLELRRTADALATVADSALASVCDALLAGIATRSCRRFFPADAVAALAAEARRRDAAGDFRTARVGRGEQRERASRRARRSHAVARRVGAGTGRGRAVGRAEAASRCRQRGDDARLVRFRRPLRALPAWRSTGAIATGSATTTRARCPACFTLTTLDAGRGGAAHPVNVAPSRGLVLSAERYAVLPARRERLSITGGSCAEAVHTPPKLVIATRQSALALWQAEHVRARLRSALPGLRCRAARADHAGRPPARSRRSPTSAARGSSSRSSSRQWPTAAPISQCIRSRTCRWTCRRASSLAAIMAREDPRDALRVRALSLARGASRGQLGRHVEPAPRGAAARALSGARASSRCAATSTRGCAGSTRASMPRSSSPPRG